MKVIYARFKRCEVGELLDGDEVRTCGCIIWDATPPAKTRWWMHRQSFIDAALAALAFSHTDLTAEWLLVGPSLMAITRSLFRFQEALPPLNRDGSIVHIGQVKGIQVFYNPEMFDKVVEPMAHVGGFDPLGNPFPDIRCPFLCGNGDQFAMGFAVNMLNTVTR